MNTKEGMTVTEIKLRVPNDNDWPAILSVANAALPWDAAGNQEWLENRQQFKGRRRHHVAEETPTGRGVGYGAVEEGPEPGYFRVFVVMAPERLQSETGVLIYERLVADLERLEARGAWVREYASDAPVLAFFGEHGFAERSRFTPPGHREMVVLVKPWG